MDIGRQRRLNMSVMGICEKNKTSGTKSIERQ